MIKMTRIYFVLFLALLSTQSCWVDPCNPNCSDSYNLLFRIVNKNTGKDLVYGPDKIYDRTQMKVFLVKGVDTTVINIKALYGSSPSDSILYFDLPARSDTGYLRLNSLDVDTLTLSYGLANSRCCTFNTIQAVNYNNSGLIQTKDSIVNLKK
jgi:hypothetical protein